MKQLNRHCEPSEAVQRTFSGSRSPRWFYLLAITLFFVSITFVYNAAFAQETVTNELNEIIANTALPENAERYAPPHCNFDMIFPTSAATTQRCIKTVNSGTEKCFNLRSFRRIYNNNSTLDVSVTCVPSSTTKFQRYNEPVMRTILKGMGAKANIDNQAVNIKNDNDYRQGVLQGSRRLNDSEKIYEAQLWIGQNSVLTVEGTMTGEQTPEADRTFKSIMSSIKKRN